MPTRAFVPIRCLLVAAVFLVSSRAFAQGAPEEEERHEQRQIQNEMPPPPPTPEAPKPEVPKDEAPATPPPPTAPPPEEAAKPPPGVPSSATFTPLQGFRLTTADGNNMLRFGLQLGLKVEPVWTNGDATKNGYLAFVRPAMRGHFFKPWFNYAVAFELAAPSPFLLTANVELTPLDEFSLRFGQQGTPVSRHTTFSVQNIFFADYASVSGYFWSGRQQGLTFFGSVADGKFEYWAGIYGGSPLRDTETDPHNYVAEARISVSPLGAINSNELPFTPDGNELPLRLSFTLQGYHGRLQQTVENYELTNSPLDPVETLLLQTMTAGGADIWFQWSRVIVFGEYYYRYVEELPGVPGHGSHGLWGEAIVNAYANLIGVGARVNWLNPNTELSNDSVAEIEGQVAWFIHAPSLSLKLRYAWLHQNSPDPAALGPFTLPFVEGTTQLGTLQLTLAF